MEGMFNIFTVYSLICVFLPCLLYQLVLVYQGGEEWETLSGCFYDLDMYISCVCVDGI